MIYDLIYHDILDFIYDEDIIVEKIGFKEKNYLISLFKQSFQNSKNKEHEQNNLLIDEYNLFLGKIIELIDFLNVDQSELERAFIIEYLLYKGYLSFNHYQKKEVYILPYHSGINIINGLGVCRHIANFYQDLNLYKHHQLLAGLLTNGEPKTIHQNTNHLINLVYYHDTIYGFDLVNKTLWSFINGSQLIDIQRKNIFLTYRSFNDLVRTNLSVEDIKRQLILYEESAKKKQLTKEEYRKIKCLIYEKLNERKRILDSFDKDNKNLKKDISNKVLSKSLN